MGSLRRSLLILYSTAAAGYGGWRGLDLWSGWGVWCFLLPPVVWAALIALADWHRNPMGWTSVKIALVLGGFGAVVLGGTTLGTAWVIAVTTSLLSSAPAVRAVLGVGLWIAASGLAWLTARSAAGAEPRQTGGSESLEGHAEQVAADVTMKVKSRPGDDGR